MKRWPWMHERRAGKGPAEGLEWSERVGWGAGKDLGRTKHRHTNQPRGGAREAPTEGDPSPSPSLMGAVFLSAPSLKHFSATGPTPLLLPLCSGMCCWEQLPPAPFMREPTETPLPGSPGSVVAGEHHPA